MDWVFKSVKLKTFSCNTDIYSFLLALLLIHEANTATAFYNVFLNSYGHCGHDKTFEVRPDQGYIVRGDISPNTITKSFRDCETNFYSKRRTGRLCVVQEGKVNEIDDFNAELLVHDGYDTEDAPLIFSLKHNTGRWRQREYCTRTPYLNFYLRKINKTGLVDVRKVYINLKVLDIESRDRKLYLDNLYCDHSYQLLNSRVNVYDRAFQNSELSARNLTKICTVRIEKEKNDNKSICFVYVPSDKMTCGNNNTWMVSVYTESQNVTYKLQCKDEKAEQWHAWCSSNRTHSVTLNFHRADSISFNSSQEQPEAFRYIFADFLGSPETLLEQMKRELISSNGSGLDTGWIVCVVLSVIVLLGSAAFLYWKRHVFPCVQYKSVHNPGNTASL